MTYLYRVCRAKYAHLDGYGASVAGGRWNSPGRAVVYMAESIALAVLENLVHMPRQDFPMGYVVVTAILPLDIEVHTQASIASLSGIPQGESQHLGDYWFDNGLSAVLRVPSFVVQSEHNFLLNPTHPNFQKIAAIPAKPFHFDQRLFN